jgi:hypothetical protein
MAVVNPSIFHHSLALLFAGSLSVINTEVFFAAWGNSTVTAYKGFDY